MPRGNYHRGAASKLGRTIGTAVGGAIDAAFHTVGYLGRTLLSPLRINHGAPAPVPRKPGAPPGIESVADVNTPPPPGQVPIRCIDYSRDRVERFEVTDLDVFLTQPRPAWAAVRWVNIDGLHPYIVHRFMTAYGFHTLAAEDVLHVPQRPKVEPFDSELFIVTRMPELHGNTLVAEQVSFFYRPDLLVSFQQTPGDVWQPVRDRLQRGTSRLRGHDASLLLHALLDAVVDHCFPILEHYGDALEDIEDRTAESPSPRVLHDLHDVKRELVLLRRVMWPMREVFLDLRSDLHKSISKTAKTYLRDVHDHAVQIIDIIETFREMAGGVTDLYMSSLSNRMNEVMKVLTIIATLFIPITFLAGVYGMNFHYFPELDEKWAYPTFWAICLVTVGSLLVWFRRKGWL